MVMLTARWLWTGQDLWEHGAIWIDDEGNVAAIGTESAVRDEVAANTPVETLGDVLLMPGLVNAHSHAFQRQFRGHVQWQQAARPGEVARGDFWTWRDAMYRTANELTPDDVESISRLCFIEMAEAGVTHVGEFHYLHHDRMGARYADPDELARRVIAAACDVGIRITLLRAVYGAGGVDAPLRHDQRRFATASPEEALAAVARLDGISDSRVTVGLAPHSVRAVPRAWLPEFATFKGPIHAHVAEQPAEVAATQAAWGCGPLAVFHAAGLVDERFTAVHLTWPEPTDAALLRSQQARVCVCPSTEQDLGDGWLPLQLREGISLCVGTDSHARIDLFAEARALEMHARALAGRRNVMSPPGQRHGLAARLLRSATLEGSAALAGRTVPLAAQGLRVGQPADCCAIDLDRPAAEGVPPLEAAAFVATPEWVRDVWVAGRRIVAAGRALQRNIRAR